MAQAANLSITSGFFMPPLSSLICDPFVRDAFDRAERDHGDTAAPAITQPRPRTDDDRAAALAFA